MLDGNGKFIDYYHRTVFTEESGKQKEQILSDGTVEKFLNMKRERRKTDKYMPNYHYSNSYGGLNDPNGLCFWKGKWHLFYQQFSRNDNGGMTIYWGHAVSEDLVKWVELPHAIYPSKEEQCWSGATLVEDNRVIAVFYGYGGEEGIYCAVSEDPLLLNWTKLVDRPVLPKHMKKLAMPHCFIPEENGDQPYNIFDPCIWKKDDTYYLLTGGVRRHEISGSQERNDYLFTSENLIDWKFCGNMTADARFTEIEDDGACPYFMPIGDRQMMLYYSHSRGAKYLIGDYDGTDRFVPVNGAALNQTSHKGGYCAPSGFPFGDGDICALYVMHTDDGPDFISLPQRFSLGGKNHDELKISPAADFSGVRSFIGKQENIKLSANCEKVLSGISGNSIEMELEYSQKNTRCLELRVMRSGDGKEYTSICFYPERGNGLVYDNAFPFKSVIAVDCANSSVTEHRIAPPDCKQILLNESEPLKLHIFLDKCVVEVFANDTVAIGRFTFPSPESVSVSLISHGADTELDSISAYEIGDIVTELYDEIL